MDRQRMFKNRQDAGEQLAQALSKYTQRDDVLVLALPRGGVPVGFEVAQALQVPLDIFFVRKLGMPGNPELAAGAIAQDQDEPFWNDWVLDLSQVEQRAIEKVLHDERKELERRRQHYCGQQHSPDVSGRVVILVDDGVATGATVRTALRALRQHPIKKLVLALPVAPAEMIRGLEQLVDELVCLSAPQDFYAIGQWYQDFSQTSDDVVIQLLQRNREQRQS